MDSKLPVFIMTLFLSRHSVIDFMQSYFPKRSTIIRFLMKNGGGVMNLVYGSSFSSYMAFMCFYSDE